ncbi:unnamed protein product [Effrenium voratum]|nr:unnamed protein product [Effrenium voratum]CAJ1429290.1 unnamed protein product [Effrenium voratum]
MIPLWEKRLLEVREKASEDARKMRLHGSILLSRPASEEEKPVRHPVPTVTDQTCWELIRQMDLDDRAERIRLAAKPGLSRALSEAGLLRAQRVRPQRKSLPAKPVVSPAMRWKAQAFEPLGAWG